MTDPARDVVLPLTDEDGGGFIAYAAGMPGCAGVRITPRRRDCLQWHRDHELTPNPADRIVPAGTKWNGRDVRWALDNGLLIVGENGWHVLTFAGLDAITTSEGGKP